MDQTSLSNILSISEEDAAFLQSVLDEVDGDINQNRDNEETTESTTDESSDITSVIEQANKEPVLTKIMEDDNESTSRFSSAIWYEKIQNQTIILAGLGGIGSHVAYLLSRMKPASMHIFDDDTVETGNLSGQMFGLRDVGSSKANAVRSMMQNYSEYSTVYAMNQRYDELCQAGDVMICGFDNMQARTVFFNKWKTYVGSISNEHKSKCLFIDGRLAAENFQVFCIKGDDNTSMQQYAQQWLFDDSEAEQTICSYKQTSFCANMIASVIVNCFVNFIANQCNPLIPRDVPFFTEYDASMMYFKTKS